MIIFLNILLLYINPQIFQFIYNPIIILFLEIIIYNDKRREKESNES